ncbi:ABC transporter permease [Agrobacterium vitis]|uniref:ABC transporter permease n=1 Tax=Agrobacterium vitis TaxID=373 RepID=UPI0012E8D438|nr:ABC transporter permease [Agrobacterium vitis]MVA23863.1 ABC transporter permease subunit [Agrobacterium vitis]
MNARSIGLSTKIISFFVLLFLAIPILIIVPLALNSGNYLRFPPQSLSLRWMEEILGSAAWLDSAWTSFKIAFGATILSIVVSLLAAIALVRGRFAMKQAVYALILLPMIVPNIISAIAMFFFFSDMPQIPSSLAIVIGHTILAIPIATIILSATLQGVDGRLENAALSLGADRITAFRRVTLPLIAPGIASAFIFAFLSSFDELLIAMFMAGTSTQTLPVRIWNSVLFQIDPSIAAVSVMLILVSVVCLLLANILAARSKGRS